MTLASYRRSGSHKRSNLRLVKRVAHKLFAAPVPLTIAQLRQSAQAQARER